MRQGKERSRIKVELKIYSVLFLFYVLHLCFSSSTNVIAADMN
jgi:hypothetical protein